MLFSISLCTRYAAMPRASHTFAQQQSQYQFSKKNTKIQRKDASFRRYIHSKTKDLERRKFHVETLAPLTLIP